MTKMIINTLKVILVVAIVSGIGAFIYKRKSRYIDASHSKDRRDRS